MFRGPRLTRTGWIARLFPGEPLSGVLSTTEFQHAFLRERSLVDRRQRPFSLIAFIPTARDPRALPRLARLLRERLRTADVVGRLNAEHLAALLPATDGKGAWVVAESILHRLAAAGLKFDCKVYVYPCDVPVDEPAPQSAGAPSQGAGVTPSASGAPQQEGSMASVNPPVPTNSATSAPLPSGPGAAPIGGGDGNSRSDGDSRSSVALVRASALGATRVVPRSDVVAAARRRVDTAARQGSRSASSAPAPAPVLPAAKDVQTLVDAELAVQDSLSPLVAFAVRRPVDTAAPAPIIGRHGELRSGPYTDSEEGSRELDAIRATADARPIEDLRPFLIEPLPLWKRAMDVVVSGLLLVALAPLFLVIAIAIKLDSPGPIIFRQQRAGPGGRPFTFFKFRSMHRDAEARRAALEAMNEKDGPIFKIKNDPRITRVGGFLRKWSLDELPQLYNVLRGDMSLVGPRPPTLNELPGYQAWQRRRLELTGGLTCIWQISGRSDVSFEEWMRMDIRYARRRTFLKDVSLIARTAGAIFTGRGAY